MRFLLTLCLLLLGVAKVSADAPFPNLPIHLTEPQGEVKGVVIFWSGDGGWSRTMQHMADAFAARGYGVVGINSLRYFWHEQAPDVMARDTGLLVDHYTKYWKSDRVVLVGYSFGADTLPFAWPLLGDELHEQTVLIALFSPFLRTEFKVTLMAMLGIARGAHDVSDAIDNLPAKRVLCVTGEEEADMACRSSAAYRYVSVPGGHRYNRDANLISQILDQAFDELQPE